MSIRDNRTEFEDKQQLRFVALREEIIQGIGNRALFLTAQYPFLLIGEILDVVSDYIQVDVETTHIEQLENRVWTLNIDTINAFYIERPGQAQIPNLNS